MEGQKKNYVDLVKNIFYLFIGNFGSKILVFLLVPLYTSSLNVVEFGIFDLISTSILLLVPILSSNISEGSLRFALDNLDNRNDIFTIGLKYICRSVFAFISLILFNNILNIFPIIKDYSLFLVFYFVAQVLFIFLTNYIRGLNLISILTIAGIINTTTLLFFNIILLKIFSLGLEGYFYANIISFMISNIYCLFVCWKKKNIRMKLLFDRELEVDMIKYSRPLIFNAIGWWINGASDRYIVTLISGIAANGLYSVSYKIPSILNIISTIFNQAWVVSSSMTIDSQDSEKFFSTIYSYYNMILVISCSILISTTEMFARILYLNDFYDAWRFVPFLLMSTIFGGLSGFAGGIFSAQKKSKVYSISTLFGAAVNIVLSLIFVWFLGPQGAAVATLISYVSIWILRMKVVHTYIPLQINYNRDVLLYFLLFIQSFCIIFIKSKVFNTIIQITIPIIICILLLRELMSLIVFVKKKIRRNEL